MIRGAALICTDSFHGTMFSINFQRNFFSFCKSSDSEESSENSRLYSALNIFGLSNRIIHNMANLTAGRYFYRLQKCDSDFGGTEKGFD